MLQVIISPAKQMRVAADAFAPRGIPPFPQLTARLHRALLDLERTQGARGLQHLWKVSDKLLGENLVRLHDFEPVMDQAQLDDASFGCLVAPAVFTYVGIQYRSMAPDVLDLDALEWLQGHLWILSGLYGCIRPFDAVQPYRLEMGARLCVDGARNLYEYWADLPADAIAHDAVADKRPAVLVNLASAEYTKAVLPHLPGHIKAVTCIFGEELRAGRPVQRATASKIARGSMVRWMAERETEDIEELKRFDVGYRLEKNLSAEDDSLLVFMRR